MLHDPAPLAVVTRSGIVESTHHGDAAVADVDGTLIAHAGDPNRVCYLRSSAKPIQALLVITTGAAKQFGLTEKELAICCGSHSGSAEHLATVRGTLEKLGLTEDALEAGPQMPSDPDERRRIMCSDDEPLPIHNNCSGKHSGMLAAARAMGVDPEGYSQPGHEVQKRTLQIVSDLCDIPADEIQQGVDGCGVVTFGMPVRNAATGYARFSTPDSLPDEYDSAAMRLADAMVAYPVMVSGEGHFNTRLLEVCGEDVVAKGGAEGLICAGLRGEGSGVAIKSADGSSRPLSPALLAALTDLNAIDDEDRAALENFARVSVTNTHGDVVGQVLPQLQLISDE